MTSERDTPSPRELSAFLSSYAGALMGAGATCIRLEKNIGRMARAYGMEAELTVMPRHVYLSLKRKGTECLLTSVAVPPTGISFCVNTALSRLSWEIADRKVSFADAQKQFERIAETKRPDKWLTTLCASLANAAFCRLFGGDLIAMGFVFAATMAGIYIKSVMSEMRLDPRVVVMVCAFVSAVIASGDALFSIGATPLTAVGTSVLYLVPGVPFLNSFSDFIYRHYLCAFSRLTDAVVLTGCLSAGLCAAMFLMRIGMF